MSGDGTSNTSPPADPEPASGWGDVPTSSDSAWGDSLGAGEEGWDQNYKQPKRWLTESPINWNLDDEEDTDMEAQDVEVTEASNCYFAQQKTSEEYEKETKAYTKTAVDQLVNSPEYLRFTTRCQMCWCVWSENQNSPSCEECGGFAMQRPCVVCKGKCGAIWERDVEMSHSEHRAIWGGECRLPEEEKAGYMFLVMSEFMDEDDVLEGLSDLSTR